MMASAAGSSSGPLRVILAILSATGWMFTSSYLILLNRHLMVDLGFKYPMFLSGMGMVASWLLSLLCCKGFRVVECKAAGVTTSFWLTKILPVGFFTAVTLWTGNEVYLYLSVAFIQMFKAFTPVITMLCLFFAGLEEPSSKTIWSVILTAGGTALAAYGEVNLSVLGLLISVASAVSESVRLVMTQYLLSGLKFHPIEGLMYSAPACCLWLYAGSAVRELPQMVDSNAMDIISAHPWKFLAAALLGFLVNVLAYTSIKLASSLTLKVLGTVKNTLLVLSSVFFMNEVVTMVQAIGYAISLIGFGWYNHVKMTQIAKDSAQLPSSSKDAANKDASPLAEADSGSLKQPLLQRDSRDSSISPENSVTLSLSVTQTTSNPVYGIMQGVVTRRDQGAPAASSVV